MRIQSKIKIVLAVLMCATFLLTACGPAATPAQAPQPTTAAQVEATKPPEPTTPPQPTQPPAVSGEKTKVVIWTAYGKQLAPAVEAYNKKMADEGKNIEVVGTQLTFESISDKFAIALTTGDVPDILDIDLVLAPMFTSKGAMLDITDQVKATGMDKEFNPKFLDLGVWQGKIFMIPFSADVSVLFYNKDIFKKAGLDPEKPPETWEDFEADLVKIRDAKLTTAAGLPVYAYATSNGAGGKMFCDMPFVWTNGGNWLDDQGNVIMDSPDSYKGMKFLSDLINVDKLIPPNPSSYSWDDKMNMFYGEQVGVICSGSYTLAEVKDRAPNLNYGVFLFPHPAGKGAPSSFIGGDVIGIPMASKHPKEAWDFITYALSPAIQVDVWAKAGMPPVRETLTKNPYFDAEPRYYIFSEGVKMGQCPKTIYYNELYVPWYAAWEDIFANQKPLDQILKEAADSMREIVSKPQ